MLNWQEDQLNSLDAIESEKMLFDKIATYSSQLGFDNCAYGLRMPLPLSNPKFAMFSNYPEVWQKRYQDKNYYAIDPTVQHGLRSQSPVIWSDKLFVSARDFWEDARSFGLSVGWAQANRCINGVYGMLSLSRSHDSLLENELQDKKFKMAWLNQLVHESMSRLVAARMMPEIRAQLSHRELEVLRWTGDGKTSSEIADIINISERTVNFHINNAMIKLQASNKTSAVVKAAMLGLLY